MGLIEGGLRLPLVGLTTANQPAVEAALRQAGCIE
jgi:hypothetical protein